MNCNPRWMVERKCERNRELLQVVIVYPEDTSKEEVKKENKIYTHKITLIKP